MSDRRDITGIWGEKTGSVDSDGNVYDNYNLKTGTLQSNGSMHDNYGMPTGGLDPSTAAPRPGGYFAPGTTRVNDDGSVSDGFGPVGGKVTAGRSAPSSGYGGGSANVGRSSNETSMSSMEVLGCLFLLG